MVWIEVSTQRREQLVDVTSRVAAVVEKSGVREGLAHAYCTHTTAGMTINENADPDVVSDLLSGLARCAPEDAGWRHAEGNADAHVKASLVGSSVTIPVSEARLVLGTWQAVYFCEFDGPRSRRIAVTVVPC